MNSNILKRILRKLGRESAKYIAQKIAFLPSENKIVSYTFDDFPLSAINNGARLLEEHNVHGTFYSSLGLAGMDDPNVGILGNRQEILALSERGHECACHTFGHINCAECSSQVIVEDCIRNQKLAQEIGNLHFNSFSYPFGEFNPSSKRAISNIYLSARTIEPGINVHKIDLAALKSVRLYESTGMKDLNLWLEKLDETGGWLIFYSHDVSENPSQYGCSTSLFEQILKSSINKGFQILTVLEATRKCVLESEI